MFTVGTLLAALRQLRISPSRFFFELEEKHGWEEPPATPEQAAEAFFLSLDQTGKLRDLIRKEIQRILQEEESP
jgi:hypothetical protein